MYYLYPILVSILPTHAIYSNNKIQISSKHYLESIIYLSIISIFSCTILNFFIKNLYLTALVYSILFYLLHKANKFYIYISIKYFKYTILNNIVYSCFYLIFCTIIGFFLYSIFKNIDLYLFSKIIFYCLLIVNFLSFMNSLSSQTNSEKENLIKKEINIEKQKNFPNIYHIILDCHIGFGIKEYFDEEFFNALKERGFYNIKNFKSNYNMTQLSMPSIMNMDYIHNLIKTKEITNIPPSITFPLYNNNVVFHSLKNLGYEINITVDPSLDNIFKSNDIKNKKAKSINQILRLICFYSLFHFNLSSLKITRKIIKKQFKIFKNLCNKAQNKQKSYNLIHLLAPHLPYLYDEKGNENNIKKAFMSESYSPYLKYINKQVIQAIDDIQKNMDSNSIIVIHGDHGLHFTPNKEHNTLCSIYLPNKNYDQIPTDLSSVNLFRLIFNKIFNTKLELLENKFYISNSTHDVNSTNLNTNFEIPIGEKEYIPKLLKNYEGKKIICYGSTEFFKALVKNNFFKNIEIIAISDKKYININEPKYDKELGFNVISPLKLHELNPDIVIITVRRPEVIIEYFKDELFKKTKIKFKYDYLIDTKSCYYRILHDNWNKLAFP